MSSAIQVNGLRKSYGSHIVLKGLDFYGGCKAVCKVEQSRD